MTLPPENLPHLDFDFRKGSPDPLYSITSLGIPHGLHTGIDLLPPLLSSLAPRLRRALLLQPTDERGERFLQQGLKVRVRNQFRFFNRSQDIGFAYLIPIWAC
jgi:hypothetical protein